MARGTHRSSSGGSKLIEQTLLDVQGVRTYLFIDFLFLMVKTYVLSEDMERKTVDSYRFIIATKYYGFHAVSCFEFHQK